MKKRTCIRLILGMFFLLPASVHAQEDAEVPPLFADSVQASWHATLTCEEEGHFLCVWSLRTSAGAHIEGTMLRTGQREGMHVRALTHPGPGCEDVRPAAGMLDGGDVLIAWQRGCETGPEEGQHVLAARFDAQLRQRERPTAMSDAAALMPVAKRGTEGDVLLAWQDYRNGGADIYAQRFHSNGTAAGDEVMINDDRSTALQGPPRIAADCRDAFWLIWSDNREDRMWKFYTAEFDGVSAGRNLLVDSAQRKAMTTLPSAVILPHDSALFAWKDYREGHSNIYYRHADLRSGSFSPAQRLNDDTTDRWQRLVVLDSDDAGNVVACWEDYRNTLHNQKGDIYLQPLARDGSFIGRNVRVNDDTVRISRKMPQIAMLRDGTYLVVWHQGHEGGFQLRGQWFRYPAERLGRNFCITCSEDDH